MLLQAKAEVPMRCFFSVAIILITSCTAVAQPLDQKKAKEVLHKVVDFYRTKVGHEGAYLWRYSADLTKQEGEGQATKTSGWTQPPGSPAVGEAFLDAWRYSGDRVCLDGAVEVAHALVRSQLKSGGWDAHFDLGEEGRKRYAYRVDGDKAGRRNFSTFDDNKSQSALALLMHVDEALGFKDEKVHGAVEYALEKMLAAQYPNGAWPQQFEGPPDPAKYPIKKASYPETWSRTYPQKDYTGYYTINDNNMSAIIDMLFEAHRIYGRKDCYRAAEKTGDFFLLAQMPDPQPGWAQQYDLDMHPAWARKFEPASITGGESQRVMRSLLHLYRHTGEKKYLDPIPRALAYYKKSLLPDGRLARFYELRENRPLYFTKDYQLTYSDADMPTHYGFKVSSSLDSIGRDYERSLAAKPVELKPVHRVARPVRMDRSLAKRAQEAVDALDSRGAWVEQGKMRYHGSDDRTREVLEMRTFAQRLVVLAQYAGATGDPE
jgi:hypothetical protein